MLDQTIPTTDVAPLRDALRGPLITPGHDGYDTARQVFAASVDRRPLAVVRAAGVDDVTTTVRFARERGLPLAVRAGAHAFAGDGVVEAGIVLDLAALDAIEFDVDGRSAWAQGGVKAGVYTDAAAEHGLATGFGDTGSVGVAGLTLGGGIGWLVRRHGLTIDSLLAAEVVTADGELLTADDDQHPDLFLALRGGGGNFGVVTRLRYRLHEVGTVFGGMVVLPAERDVLTGLVTLAGGAPDDLSMIIHAAKAPPAPFLPAEVHGRPIIMATFLHAGSVAEGEGTLAAIRALATPLAEDARPMAYPEIVALGGPGPDRAAIAVRNGFADAFDAADADLVLERLATATTPMAMTQIRVLGGAVARVAPDATAYAHRDREMLVITAAVTNDAAGHAEAEAWADDTAVALGLPASGAYVNYLSDDGEATVRRAYPEATLERLRRVKRRSDPENLLRVNRNVVPEPARP